MIRAAILTVSDSAAAGTRPDASGPALRSQCDELGWSVAAAAVVPDSVDAIRQCLVDWADGGVANVILTTGGTGIAPRDVTPEATGAILDRQIPGIAETIRDEGRAQTKFSVLSRALAGSRGEALIVNLPGSPKGAVYSLSLFAGLVPHIVDLLAGRTGHE